MSKEFYLQKGKSCWIIRHPSLQSVIKIKEYKDAVYQNIEYRFSLNSHIYSFHNLETALIFFAKKTDSQLVSANQAFSRAINTAARLVIFRSFVEEQPDNGISLVLINDERVMRVQAIIRRDGIAIDFHQLDLLSILTLEDTLLKLSQQHNSLPIEINDPKYPIGHDAKLLPLADKAFLTKLTQSLVSPIYAEIPTSGLVLMHPSKDRITLEKDSLKKIMAEKNEHQQFVDQAKALGLGYEALITQLSADREWQQSPGNRAVAHLFNVMSEHFKSKHGNYLQLPSVTKGQTMTAYLDGLNDLAKWFPQLVIALLPQDLQPHFRLLWQIQTQPEQNPDLEAVGPAIVLLLNAINRFVEHISSLKREDVLKALTRLSESNPPEHMRMIIANICADHINGLNLVVQCYKETVGLAQFGPIYHTCLHVFQLTQMQAEQLKTHLKAIQKQDVMTEVESHSPLYAADEFRCPYTRCTLSTKTAVPLDALIKSVIAMYLLKKLPLPEEITNWLTAINKNTLAFKKDCVHFFLDKAILHYDERLIQHLGLSARWPSIYQNHQDVRPTPSLSALLPTGQVFFMTPSGIAKEAPMSEGAYDTSPKV